MGGRTYTGDDPNRGTDSEGAFGGTWHGPQFVLTRDPAPARVPDVTFVGDIGAGLAGAKAAAGEQYVNALGADTARRCLEVGQLDEVLTIVAPVLLGDGTPLFSHPGGRQVDLEQLRVTRCPTPRCCGSRARRLVGTARIDDYRM